MEVLGLILTKTHLAVMVNYKSGKFSCRAGFDERYWDISMKNFSTVLCKYTSQILLRTVYSLFRLGPRLQMNFPS